MQAHRALYTGLAALSLAALPGCWPFGPDEDVDGDGYPASMDCDDEDASIHPDAVEHCDGVDEDCDRNVDEGAVDGVRWYADRDLDGYGDVQDWTRACTAPDRHGRTIGDCDDQRADVHPGAEEYCDGRDNDCDRAVDEDALDPATFWADSDGDGAGAPGESIQACEPPEGYVGNARDCDDTTDQAAPGLIEVCADGLDNDCLPDTTDACGYTRIDLRTSHATLLPRAANANLGWSVVGAGDIDDDGFDDLLIGAPSQGPAADGAWVVSGPITGRTDVATVGQWLAIEHPGSVAGRVVAAGDLNDDGYGDVMLGMPSWTHDEVEAGAVMVRYGPDVADCEPFCSGAILRGAAPGERVGEGLDAADVSGDGSDELVIGAPGVGSHGAVVLVHGVPSGQVALVDVTRSRVLGDGDSGSIGSSLALGDLDHDGRDDLVLLDAQTGSGTAWVHLDVAPGDSALSSADLRVEGDEAHVLRQASLGDVDGDGRDDLVLGLHNQGPSPADAVVLVFSDPSPGVLTPGDATSVLSGERRWANAGAQVQTGGDFNGDGVGDLLVGAPLATTWLPSDTEHVVEQPGTIYAVPGPLSDGTVSLGTLGSARLFSPATRDLEVFSLAFVGDTDRDGFDDVLIGARRHEGLYPGGGVAWLVSGRGL